MSPTTTDPATIFDRIRDNITKSFECRQLALNDIVTVHRKRLWKHLGYSSFENCLEAELKIGRFPLKKPERQEAVEFLDGAGLTTRAIAAALDVPQTTVVRDVRSESSGSVARSGGGSRSGNGAGTRKVGLDGRSRPARRASPEPEACNVNKAETVRSAMRDLGRYAQQVGKRLEAVKFQQIDKMSMDELQTLSDHIYRARHGLKNCEARLP